MFLPSCISERRFCQSFLGVILLSRALGECSLSHGPSCRYNVLFCLELAKQCRFDRRTTGCTHNLALAFMPGLTKGSNFQQDSQMRAVLGAWAAKLTTPVGHTSTCHRDLHFITTRSLTADTSVYVVLIHGFAPLLLARLVLFTFSPSLASPTLFLCTTPILTEQPLLASPSKQMRLRRDTLQLS
jgi:hypothetical protein